MTKENISDQLLMFLNIQNFSELIGKTLHAKFMYKNDFYHEVYFAISSFMIGFSALGFPEVPFAEYHSHNFLLSVSILKDDFRIAVKGEWENAWQGFSYMNHPDKNEDERITEVFVEIL